MFSYNVNAEASEKAFKEACERIEKEIKSIEKEDVLLDVDGSKIQIYAATNGKIKVYNDYEVDAVYIDSEIELKSFN